jgi:acetyltransferase-like isoleucine patch superfamily enzyme
MNRPKILNTGIREVNFGVEVKVVQPVNLYECTIGNNCFIGPFVEIQKGVVIGNNCKVQSHAFICELVTISDNCFIGHGVMFINDKFKSGNRAAGNRQLWESTNIGKNVSIGSNATILPVNICDDVVIGAGSVVTKSISEPGVYAGCPAKKLR